jgi:hypothetical protein
VLLLHGDARAAKPIVAVLSFGSDAAEPAREALMQSLGKRYDVLDGQKLLDACDQLGITMSRGPNLAQAAAHIGAVAVVGGALKGGKLVLAVYSGKTGQPLTTGGVPCGGRLSKPNLAKALAILQRGLQKAPKRVGRPGQRPPTPTPSPAEGAPEGGGGNLTFDPNAPSGGGRGPEREENPLAPKPPAAGAAAGPSFTGPGEAVVAKKPKEDAPAEPRLDGELGLGTWIRDFSMNDPKGTSPKYQGTAFTLRLALVARPAGFFTSNFASNIFLRLHYQRALGLQSKSTITDASGQSVDKTFGTTLHELVFDVGYNWKIFGAWWSPTIDAALGYGFSSFTIDWQDTAEADKSMPNFGYSFLVPSLGARFPIIPSWFGAHLTFDYRAVLGTGEIEEEKWYGPTSAGGIDFIVGVHGTYRGFVASADYTYTRYFFSFTDAEARLKRRTAGESVRVAGGALDNYHVLMLNLGYTY